MKLSNIRVDVVAVEQGGWVDNIPDMEDLRLKTRAEFNDDWRRLYGQLYDALPREQKVGRLDPAVADQLNARCILECGLVGWENFLDEATGEPIPFSKEKAAEFLFDKQYRPFLAACLHAARTVAQQAGMKREADAGN
jgi:hypothetical protein